MRWTVALMVSLLGGYSYASEFHGVTFTDITSSQMLGDANTNYRVSIADGATMVPYSPKWSFSGLWLDDNTGFKFNNSKDVSVKYLHLGAGITFRTSDQNSVGSVNWSDTNSHKINVTDGGWFDINTTISGTNVGIASGASITLYLNQCGLYDANYGTSTSVNAITLSVAEINALDSTAASMYSVADLGNGLYAVTRTLSGSGFSSADGYQVSLTDGKGSALTLSGTLADSLVNSSVSASDVGSYYVGLTDAGQLKVTYVTTDVPEPAAAALSLLALAGVAARRRRRGTGVGC